MDPLVEQIAALPGWQRARINWIRVSGSGLAIVEWLGMQEVADPRTPIADEIPASVSVASWVKPAPHRLQIGVAAIEDELAELAHSGLLGDMVVDPVTAPAEVRWQAQAWVGHDSRALVIDRSAEIMLVMEADADLRLARWRVTQAEHALQARVRDALAAGESALATAAALGVTRSRVYQLRDGRR